MIANKKPIPVVDLFAGPGGLGEGFAALGKHEGIAFFKIGLSIEKEKAAHRTLRLRSFFRQFPFGQAPEEYYDFLRGKIISEDELYTKFPSEAEKSVQEARLFTLGNGGEEDAKLDKWIEEVLQRRNKWVLIGGPPCQAYSVIGRSRTTGIIGYKPEYDKRSYLYREYLRIIAKHRPAVFVMENVQGILSSKLNGQRIFDKIMSDVQQPSPECSYKIHSLAVKRSNSLYSGSPLNPMDYVIKSERYGIPQARHRVILLGIRDDLSSIEPETLTPSEMVSLCDVLMDLPKLRSGLSRESDSTEAWCRVISDGLDRRWLRGVRRRWGNKLAETLIHNMRNIHGFKYDRGYRFIPQVSKTRKLDWWYGDSRLGGICCHETRSHMTDDLWRYLFSTCFSKVQKLSPKLQDFPPDLLPQHKNVKTGHFNDRFRVQQEDLPSNTITSHISKDGHYYIHPDPLQCRSLTVREAARLQTFPDNYFFCGNRTEQYVQVGNAVPPLLSYKVAEIVKNIIYKTN